MTKCSIIYTVSEISKKPPLNYEHFCVINCCMGAHLMYNSLIQQL